MNIRKNIKTLLAGASGVSLTVLNVVGPEGTSIIAEMRDIVGLLADFFIALASLATFVWLMTQSIDRGGLIRQRMRERSEARRIIKRRYYEHKAHTENTEERPPE